MTSTADNALRGGAEPQIVDVWSRTARKYRIRAAVMLVVLAVLFAGLCCFTFWLRTGVYRPWSYRGYETLMAQSFRPTGSSQITLNDFLSAPINVTEVPIHGLIMGLLLASLSSIPLLVAILYRFPASVLFAAMVMFIAAMPWLGLTVLLGCTLTVLRPFRFSFRYASALIGLIPIAVYFVTASLEPANARPKLVQHRALLYAPWVLAVLGSCIICAVALGVARLINYRPGGIAPLLALLFAIPIALFHTQVGRDELEYRLLEQEVGPGNRTVFASVDVGAIADREGEAPAEPAQQELRPPGETPAEPAQQELRPPGVSYEEVRRQALEKAGTEALEDAADARAEAIAHCESFIEQYPRSRYVSNVLFLKGRAQDQRARIGRDYRLEFRNDLPGRASRITWETLMEKFPDEPVSAMAFYKLAVLRARDGRMDEAAALLNELIERFDVTQATTKAADLPDAGRARLPPSRLSRSFALPARPSTRLDVDPAILVRQARRLREMLAACRDDASKPYDELFVWGRGEPDLLVHPLQLLLSLDDADPSCRVNLEGLARHFPNSETRGYVEVRLALMQSLVRLRIHQLEDAAPSLKGRPAGAEAMFELGAALQEDRKVEEARGVFDELTKLYPESCWAHEAKKRLSSLSMLETAKGE